MEIDLLRPSLQIKIFLSVFWMVFLLVIGGVELPIVGKIFIAIGTVLFVVGWFVYPYPLDVLVKNVSDKERESRDQE